MTTATNLNNHKLEPLQVEFRHPDQPDLPLDAMLQQPLADAIFTDPAYPVSTELSTGTTEADIPDAQTTEAEELSHGTAPTDLMPPKRKRGRPRKVKTPVPMLPDVNTASKYLNKSSVFYLRLYSNLLTLEEVRARLSDPCKKTVAEQFALELLISAANKKERDLNRYWNIISKPDKSTENVPKTQKNSTILDDILTSVEAEVFGDIPEADTTPTPDKQKS